MNEVEHLVSSQCKLGEGPVWHPDEKVLYWLDIYQHNLHRFDPQTGSHTITGLGLLASAMGIRSGSGFVMATKQGFAFWEPATKHFAFISNPDPDISDDVRFNDGKTDRQGRFWAGKMSTSPQNSLFRLDPDRSVRRMESGIYISNGLGWSPDNRIFYYTDSTIHKIYAYDFDADSGEIANQRVFVEVPDTEGTPDGLAVDVEGCIWSARWGGWKIVRYDPQGQVICEVRMPVQFPTSCAFGGANLDELYITSAWVEVGDDHQTTQPMAGDLFRLNLDVPGFAEPHFAG